MSILDELKKILLQKTLCNELTWSTKRVHYREKSYHVVEESSDIS